MSETETSTTQQSDEPVVRIVNLDADGKLCSETVMYEERQIKDSRSRTVQTLLRKKMEEAMEDIIDKSSAEMIADQMKHRYLQVVSQAIPDGNLSLLREKCLVEGQKKIIDAGVTRVDFEEILPDFTNSIITFYSLLKKPGDVALEVEAKKIYFDVMKTKIFEETLSRVELLHQEYLSKAVKHIADHCDDLEEAVECIGRTATSINRFMNAIRPAHD